MEFTGQAGLPSVQHTGVLILTPVPITCYRGAHMFVCAQVYTPLSMLTKPLLNCHQAALVNALTMPLAALGAPYAQQHPIHTPKSHLSHTQSAPNPHQSTPSATPIPHRFHPFHTVCTALDVLLTLCLPGGRLLNQAFLSRQSNQPSLGLARILPP